jgi:hypothetical protein
MLTGQRSVRRRRIQRSRAARIAVPLAIPVALGVTLGVVIAVSHSGNSTTLQQSAFGSRHHFGGARPSASASPTASASATASGTASPAVGAAATVAPANSFAGGQVAFRQLGDIATNPVDGTGAAINLNQTPAPGLLT